MKRCLFDIITLLLMIVIFQSCKGSADATKTGIDENGENVLPDTLRVGTLYSPTSFFIYREDTMGLDYEKICNFAKDKHIALKFTVAQNVQSLIELIKNKKVDVLAYEIPVTDEFNQEVLHCGETNTTYQVLVQRKNNGKILNDVSQLAGKDVYVIKGTKYQSRLEELNSEIGGINIHLIDNDIINVQDLIDQVNDGSIDMTIVDSDIAMMSKTNNNNIDISLEVSFPQRSSWAVNLESDWLCDTIDAWSTNQRTILYSEDVSHLYFDQDNANDSTFSYSELGHRTKGKFETTDRSGNRHSYQRHSGDISPFDDLFKRYAVGCVFDWKMLAAIAYTESSFNPNCVSWAGARGLMQIMPSTVRKKGITNDELMDPEVSVRCAVDELNRKNSYYSRLIPDPQERMRFILASYNAGSGHITDAMRLAEKYGKDPKIWYGNVEEALKMESNEKYYNDPVCKYGYCRATETVNYVHKVENRYNQLLNR